MENWSRRRLDRHEYQYTDIPFPNRPPQQGKREWSHTGRYRVENITVFQETDKMKETLSEMLKKLRLSGLASTLEVRLQEASGNHLTRKFHRFFCFTRRAGLTICGIKI